MTIDACVSEWDAMVNWPAFYDNSGSRCRPYPYRGRDCSTFAAQGLNAGFPGAVDPCSNSFSQAAWCHDAHRTDAFIKRFGPGQGTFITYEQAQHTVCLGFRGTDYGRRPDYTGDGHVECILGQGKRTVGAHSHATGVGYDNNGLDNHQLSYFAVPPCFLPELAGPPIDAATLEAIKKLLDWNRRVTAHPLLFRQTNGDVTILNKLLIARGVLSNTSRMNLYSKYTRAAVHNFKVARGLLSVDGRVFGGEAAAALLRPR